MALNSAMYLRIRPGPRSFPSTTPEIRSYTFSWRPMAIKSWRVLTIKMPEIYRCRVERLKKPNRLVTGQPIGLERILLWIADCEVPSNLLHSWRIGIVYLASILSGHRRNERSQNLIELLFNAGVQCLDSSGT